MTSTDATIQGQERKGLAGSTIKTFPRYTFRIRGNNTISFHLSRDRENIIVGDLNRTLEDQLFRQMIRPYIDGTIVLSVADEVEINYRPGATLTQ
jgi:hypothetical protein